jgi:hypothetical protein
MDRPEDCTAICAANPEIPGCSVVTTPAPKCPEKCCQEQNSKCLSCQACLSEEDYCADNRDVEGCDAVCCELGCSKECSRAPLPDIVVGRECRWQVVDNQYTAFRPTILEANVERDCPFADKFMLHVESCEKCAAQHKPCNNTYMACGGCCGTPWHAILGLGVNTYHTCDEIKHYFKEKNQCTLDMKDPTAITDDNAQSTVVDSGGFKVGVQNGSQPSVIDSGIIREGCNTSVTKLECKKIPFTLKFECDDCQNKGAPRLLDKCCDECVRWAASLDGHPGIDPAVQPYVWCSGCNSTTIESGNPAFPPMTWRGASKYTEYTYEKAHERVEAFITDEVCSLLAPECPATTPKPRLLRGLSEEGAADSSEEDAADKTQEAKTGQCFSAGNCAKYNETELGGAGDRRLSTPLSTDSTDLSPSVFCKEFDFDSYDEVPVPEKMKMRVAPAKVAGSDEVDHNAPTDAPVQEADTPQPTPQPAAVPVPSPLPEAPAETDFAASPGQSVFIGIVMLFTAFHGI